MIRFPIAALIAALLATPLAAQEDAALRAAGNEPFWSLDLTDETLTLDRMDAGEVTLPVTDVTIATAASGTVLRIVTAEDGAADGLRASLLLTDVICRDSMSGMSFPATAEVAIAGTLLRGCAGAPEDLFAGIDWQVLAVRGETLPEGSEAELRFGRDGSLSGSGGCNRLIGTYERTGEGLRIPGGIGMTMMACPDPVMTRERAFVTALEAVAHFEIADDGKLLLLGEDGAPLIAAARRDTAE